MSTDTGAVDVSSDTVWETVVGLEVHCELATTTKLFCGCRNKFGEEPNTNVCPVCLGLPGSLPVLNAQAVELAMRIGTALHCDIHASSFARKNYFYPDQAKDYQISQYDEPINLGGWLELPGGHRVGVTRAHLEEDTGKLTHVGAGGRIHSALHALVDYNRSGVPLVEIVSEPDIRSAAQARAYAAELRGILVATGASDGRLEEGSMRFDANVSVRPVGTAAFGTRCEIKNLNSLRSLGRAIEYEAARQIALIENGESVDQETRHWDEAAGRTQTMRSKEEANDYRYFPEPDLVPLVPDAEWQARVRQAMGPMPADRRAALVELVGGSASDAESDQIRSVVDLGLDELVVDGGAGRGAGQACVGPGRQRAGRRGGGRPGSAAVLVRDAARDGVERRAVGHAVQGRVERRRGRGRERSAGDRQRDGLRGSRCRHVDGRRGRRGVGPPRRMGALPRGRRQVDGLLHRSGHEGDVGPGQRQRGGCGAQAAPRLAPLGLARLDGRREVVQRTRAVPVQCGTGPATDVGGCCGGERWSAQDVSRIRQSEQLRGHQAPADVRGCRHSPRRRAGSAPRPSP